MSYRAFEPNAIGSIVPPFGGGSGGGGGGGAAEDRFAPKYVVGNTSNGDSADTTGTGAGFTYIADPGDGSGIAAAITAAGVTAGDIWIRPGTYDLKLAGSPIVPFTVPTGVTVRGSGDTTRILGRITGDQRIFVLGASASLREMRLNMFNDVQSGTGTGMVECQGTASARCWIDNVDFQMDYLAGSTGTIRAAIFVSANSSATVRNSRFFLDGSNGGGATGGRCAILAAPAPIGFSQTEVLVTQCDLSCDLGSGGIDCGIISEAKHATVVETIIRGAAVAHVVAYGVPNAPNEASLVLAQSFIDGTNPGNGDGVLVNNAAWSARLVNNRVNCVYAGSTTRSVVSVAGRGVLSSNDLSGNVDTSGGSDHIIVGNLLETGTVLFPSGTDEVAHNVTY